MLNAIAYLANQPAILIRSILVHLSPEQEILCEIQDAQRRVLVRKMGIVSKREHSRLGQPGFAAQPERPEIVDIAIVRPGPQRGAS